MRILVTGAAGNIGRKLVDHLRAVPGAYDVVCLDVAKCAPYTDASHDLSKWNDSWTEQFVGVDVVVHLAADRYPTADWKTVLPLNIDLLLNVYEAARKHRVSRIIFASSNWVLGGYRFEGNVCLTHETSPRPVNPYGAAKLFGERIGKQLSDIQGISVINLRIGYNQWLRDNMPSPEMELGAWGQMLWLSDRDYCQAMEKAIIVKDVAYATLNVTSRTIGSRWDLSETERVLGYVPQDEYRVTLPPRVRLTQGLARLRDRGGSALRRCFSEDW